MDERFSVNVGAVRYTERYKLDGVVSAEVLREAMAAIAADLSRIDGRLVPAALVVMGGAVTNITAVREDGLARYDPAIVQGTVLDRAEIDRQIELYRSRDADARRTIIGLQPEAGGSHPGRRVHRPDGHGKTGQADPHGERPGPAPWGADRTLWWMNTEPAMQTRKSVKASKTVQAGKGTKSRKARKVTPAGPMVALSNEQVTRVLKLLKGRTASN